SWRSLQGRRGAPPDRGAIWFGGRRMSTAGFQKGVATARRTRSALPASGLALPALGPDMKGRGARLDLPVPPRLAAGAASPPGGGDAERQFAAMYWRRLVASASTSPIFDFTR